MARKARDAQHRYDTPQQLEDAIPGIWQQLAEEEQAVAAANYAVIQAKDRLQMRRIRHDALRQYCEAHGWIEPGVTAASVFSSGALE